jgi:23S rRNA (pseudouridine1915-N3)-methyltransferase
MRLWIIAVGTRMPSWVNEGYAEFARRFPKECALNLSEVKAEPRNTGKTPLQMMQAEGQRLWSAKPAGAHAVVLDERGDDVSTPALTRRLEQWQGQSSDIAFLIGGPDGLDPAIKAQADERIRLSSLTLPHAMVRPLLAEALYRAWSCLKNHPYHRE